LVHDAVTQASNIDITAAVYRDGIAFIRPVIISQKGIPLQNAAAVELGGKSIITSHIMPYSPRTPGGSAGACEIDIADAVYSNGIAIIGPGASQKCIPLQGTAAVELGREGITGSAVNRKSQHR
jgi:hypothetical protein